MATCQSITNDGVKCTHKAKNGGVCGTHARVASTPEINKSNIYKRFADMVRTFDRDQIITWRTRDYFDAFTVDEMLAYVEAQENILRPAYPGYPGHFLKSKAGMIIPFRVQTNRERAYERMPANLRNRPDQRALLPGWFEHFHSCVVRALQEANMHAVVPATVGMVYDMTYIRETLQVHLVAAWARVQLETKRQLHRCFTNMGILGQTDVMNLGLMLPLPVAGAAAAFTQDNQNVHRSETVKYVTDTYNKLLKIAVPTDQNTLAEIIQHCKLPPKAIMLLTNHYCDPVDIYDLPKPYPKAIDAVWAYIRVHPEKQELYVRVRDELTDNIGMCAQGNLSRLCNILSGYLDGITPPVAKGELVQQKISAIAMDDEGDKVVRGRQALREMEIPEEDWAPWIEALEGME